MLPEIDLKQKKALDARTFQTKLEELTTTVAFKVQREGYQHGLQPAFLVADMYYLLRQAQQTYNLFFFINADERRNKDVDWRPAYSAVILPLVRTMIDCLYNVTAILQNPGVKAHEFRASGYKLALQVLDADEQRYGGDPQWGHYIKSQRTLLASDMAANGFVEAEVRTAPTWLTLGAYLRIKKTATPTPHQAFLRKLTFGFWQEYSGMSHATFQGLLPIALFLAPKDLIHEDRPKIDTAAVVMIATHVSRLAGILLCTLTEIQAYCKFDGAHINRRLHEVWNALIVVPEIKELYDGRYSELMKEKGINAD